MPAPAAALLDVALLRAECHRLGLNELSISTSEARIGPIDLKASESIRLRRLAKDAIHKEGARQLVLSIPRGRQPAEFLVGFLRELVEPPAGWTDPRPVAATSL